MVTKSRKRVKILGLSYLLRFVGYPYLPKKSGECDTPKKPRREIRVRKDLPPVEIFTTLIHEVTHGAFWWLDEEYVSDFAESLSGILLDKDIRPRWENN